MSSGEIQQLPAAWGGIQVLGTRRPTVTWPRSGRQPQRCDGGDQLQKLIYHAITNFDYATASKGDARNERMGMNLLCDSYQDEDGTVIGRNGLNKRQQPSFVKR